MKSEKMVKRSSFGSIVRKRLSDITNALPQPKSPINLEKPSKDSSSAKEHINHLLKENVALVKLIQDKNKIIELSGVELQKLRVSLQKLQLQNWNLAQSNSHMISELNLGKEKLKSLQHEVLCKESLLKAKNMEPKEQERTNCQNVQDRDAARALSRANEDKKLSNGSRKHRVIRSRSMGHSTTLQQVTQQEAAENKRRCLRRKSASVRMQQQEPSEDLFELDDDKLLPTTRTFDSPAHVNGPNPLQSPINNRAKDEKHSSGFKSPRASLGRPSRKAAEKVQSYKEIPVNVKMRRTE